MFTIINNGVQHGHLRYWGLTSEFQLNSKAKHKSWAGPDPQTNHRNFKFTNSKSIANRADVQILSPTA